MALKEDALVDGILFLVAYTLLLVLSLFNNGFQLVRWITRRKRRSTMSSHRWPFRIGNYASVLSGITLSVCMISFYIRSNDEDSEPFDFFMAYEVLDILISYGLLFTFYFTITAVFGILIVLDTHIGRESQLCRLLPVQMQLITRIYEGLISFNLGFQVFTIVSNLVVLIYGEVLWQKQDCFYRLNGTTSFTD